jgi:hypothetical protein
VGAFIKKFLIIKNSKMALKTNTGYVRIGFSSGLDGTKLHVNWYTYKNANWREENPYRVWASVSEQGTHIFDLAIKEIKSVELDNPYQDELGNIITHEEREVITGYLPQTIEQAHELLKNLLGKDCNFKSINFQIVT